MYMITLFQKYVLQQNARLQVKILFNTMICRLNINDNTCLSIYNSLCNYMYKYTCISLLVKITIRKILINLNFKITIII